MKILLQLHQSEYSGLILPFQLEALWLRAWRKTVTEDSLHPLPPPLQKKTGFFRGNTPISFYKQSIFDPRPENCLSFSKKPPQKII